MRGVIVIPLTNPRITEKGEVYSLDSWPTEGLGIYYRHKGAIAGQHYHRGTDPHKNPERHLLLKGSMRLVARDLATGETETALINAPAIWEIYPNIYHELECLEDCIFLEQRARGQTWTDDVYSIT